FKQKTAYELFTSLEFRRVLFRSRRPDPRDLTPHRADEGPGGRAEGERHRSGIPQLHAKFRRTGRGAAQGPRQIAETPVPRPRTRSEERRVGKESRSSRADEDAQY